MEDAALSMPMVQSALDLSMPLEQLNLELSMPLTQSGLDMSLPPGDSAAGDDGGEARESVRLEGDGAAPGGDLVRAGFLAGVTALLFAAAAFAVKARQDRRGRDSGYDADSERDEREEAADVGGTCGTIRRGTCGRRTRPSRRASRCGGCCPSRRARTTFTAPVTGRVGRINRGNWCRSPSISRSSKVKRSPSSKSLSSGCCYCTKIREDTWRFLCEVGKRRC